MFLKVHPKDQVSVITPMVVMGCRRVYEYAEGCEKSLLRWGIVIKMCCHHRRQGGTEEKGCLGTQGWHYIILFLFSTSGVMQLFSGGQLTTNYLLNREVKPLDLNPRLREWRRTGHSLTVHSIPGPTDGRSWNPLIILRTVEGNPQDGGYQFLSPVSEVQQMAGTL